MKTKCEFYKLKLAGQFIHLWSMLSTRISGCKMSILYKTNLLLKRSSWLMLLSCLTACANMAPGMFLGADTAAISAQDVARPEPVIKLITANLLASEKAAKALLPPQDLTVFLGEPKRYLIGNGDLLSILVWDHPELSVATIAAQALSTIGAQTPSGFLVDQDGMIQFPYVGPIKLSGLTELQARSLLSQRLLASIKNPDMTLRVQIYRSKRIYVDGEVKTPGTLTIDDVPMTLLEALTRAGGMLPSADQSNIVISRAGVSYQINLPLLVQSGIVANRLLLVQGDVVRVISREESKVYVLGEVNAPKALLMNNGRLTLTQALGETGGLNQLSAAGRQVYVIRNASAAQPIVYSLDARSPVALALSENFELNPQDVVYVDASGLARFNRLISLIIPGSSAAVSTGKSLK